MVNKALIISLIVVAIVILTIIGAIYFDVFGIVKGETPEQKEQQKEEAITYAADKAFSGSTSLIVGILGAILSAVVVLFIASKIGGDVEIKKDMTWEEMKKEVILPKIIRDYGLVVTIGNSIHYNKDDVKFPNHRRYEKPEGRFMIGEIEINTQTSGGNFIIDGRKDLTKEELIGGDFTWEENIPIDLYWKKDAKLEKDYPKSIIRDPRIKAMEALKDISSREEYIEALRKEALEPSKEVKVSVDKPQEKDKIGRGTEYAQNPQS